jgi:hypothetical protein
MYMVQTVEITEELLKELPKELHDIKDVPQGTRYIKIKGSNLWRISLVGGKQYFLAQDKDIQVLMDKIQVCFEIKETV